MAFVGVLIGIFIICLAFLWNEGFWSNTLTLINVLLAGLVATNWFEPVADLLDTKLPTFTYLLDYLAFWLLFFLAFAVMRAVTDAISITRLKFIVPLETTGSILMCCAVGWLMMCLVHTSLHLSPLGQTAFRGGFQPYPLSNDFFGVAPDRMWLGFIQSRSQGALSKSAATPFDPQGEFIYKYATRRDNFSKEMEMRVKR